ncbi:Dolichyl-phosphate-mannose-protein mannosyltransferase [Noviherbaspirillum humi]|uniref:Dolichyl-phosphate-mannose-protein mannosyltransferase n=1 Tax=Noviherbaspirillum humi TaxID=1688639 RepID=A0A239CUI1_9BURK|nr:phospholipid carrier-dependent glycosyltransferase [Noviherbaspirillum humi]SNS23609.1 Dolichyl-phosphate-mannose-protein mannosyltransferase [Noviherbaspirillum humi]
MNRVLPTVFNGLAGLAALIGTGLVIHGLSLMAWPDAIPFSDTTLLMDSPLLRFLLLLLVAAVLVTTITLASRCKPLVAAAAVATLLALGTGLMGAFVVVAWFALASIVLGRGVLRVARAADTGPEASNILPLVLGAGLYGSIVSLLAHLPLNYPGVYAVGLALPLAFGWRSTAEILQRMAGSIVRIDQNPLQGKTLEMVIGVVLLVHVLAACLPELGYDALAMHLFIPGYLRGRHQWNFDVSTYVWAVMPMLGDWIFSIGYMLGGETAARLMNVGFIIATARLVTEMVRWAGGSESGGRWAALVFLSTPLTFTESSSLFIESAWGAFLIAGTFALLRACSSKGDPRDLRTAGLLLGYAAAAKAVTLTVLPVLGLALLVRWRRLTDKTVLLAVIQAMGAFLVVGGIPYLTAFLKTGNPVFPLFNAIFRSPYFPPENFAPPDVFAKGVRWDTLYAITFDTTRYLEGKVGTAGFHWLLLLIPACLLLLGSRSMRGLVIAFIAAASIVLTFQSTAYLRYVFPSFAMLAMVVGIGFSAVETRGIAVRAIVSTLLAAGAALNLLFFNAGAFYADFEPRAALSQAHRYDYLQQRIPIRNAVELVNRLNAGHTPVAVFSMPYTAGLEADGLYPNWYNLNFYEAIKNAASESALAEVLLAKAVDFVILDPAWDTPEKRRLIESVTDQVANFGGITVRSINSRYRFQKELLQHPGFDAAEGWTMQDGAKLDQGLIASVNAPAYQVVPVAPGRRYRNSVRAACAEQPTKGRLQVNWQDARSRFIRADIQLFDCSPEAAEHQMEVIAPDGAAFAVVYASGHTPIPVRFKQVSFR